MALFLYDSKLNITLRKKHIKDFDFSKPVWSDGETSRLVRTLPRFTTLGKTVSIFGPYVTHLHNCGMTTYVKGSCED